jgi:hypothetical protein
VIDLDLPKNDKSAPEGWRIPGVRSGEDVLAVLADRTGASYVELWETFTVRTASGGVHLYFAAPAGVELHNTTGGLGWLIDTRAHGGSVVAPGSIVDGKPYEILHNSEPLPLPGWLTNRLMAVEKSDVTADPARVLRTIRSGADRRTKYANSALAGEVKTVLAATQGERNTTLHRAAFALGQLVGDGLLPDHVVVDALSAAGQAIGLPVRECVATIRSGVRAGLAHPRGGAA